MIRMKKDKKIKLDEKRKVARIIVNQMQDGFNWTTTEWSVQELVDAINNGTLVEPDYQRDGVWKIHKSQFLIETVIRYGAGKIPILTFRKLEDGRYELVDGKQRITQSLKPFYENKFRLTGVFNPQLKGLTLKDLEEDDTYYSISDAFVHQKFRIQIANDMSYDEAVTYFVQINTSGVNMWCGEQIHAYQQSPIGETINKLKKHNIWDYVTQIRRHSDYEYISRMLLFVRDKHDYGDTPKIHSNEALLSEVDYYKVYDIPKSIIKSLEETFTFLEKIFEKYDLSLSITELFSFVLYVNLYGNKLNNNQFGEFVDRYHHFVNSNNPKGVFKEIKKTRAEKTSKYYTNSIQVIDAMFTKFVEGDDWSEIQRLKFTF